MGNRLLPISGTRAWPAAFALCAASCAPVSSAGVGADPFSTGGGKADDFFSTDAREFVVRGRARVTLEQGVAGADEATRRARLEELIGYRHLANAYFLTQYLVEKDSHDPNNGYGGAGGLAKASEYSELDITAVDGRTTEFTFEQVIAGRENLLGRLPIEEEGGQSFFTVEMGTPSNEELAQLETDREWFRTPPWKNWNPAVVDPALRQPVRLAIEPEEPGQDAWLDFDRLLEDGKLTISVFFGYDYHSDYHRKHARAVYLWLKNEEGYTSPISSFDELSDETPPFTKTIMVRDAQGNERVILVEVKLVYGKDGSPTDPATSWGGQRLERRLREAMATSDVIQYSGHAGPFYGFSLANWKQTNAGDVSYRELAEMPMPADRYQVVIADGCDTYQIGQAFERNPNKLGGANIDVITTTTFSDATEPYSAMNMIYHFTEVDPDEGWHRPRTVRGLLLDLTAGNSDSPLYGIHFIADNPKIQPYGDLSYSCAPCESHRHCGAPGNRCVFVPGADSGYCASACTSDDVCPDGYSCLPIAAPSAQAVYEYGCVPSDYVCD